MNVATRYRKLPIRTKLRLMVMVSGGMTLVAACGTLLTFENITFRADLRNDLGVLAEMYGANSAAALSFNDRQAAGELLSGFRVKRHIASAILYSTDGKVFAAYQRDPGSSGPAPQLRADGSWFE